MTPPAIAPCARIHFRVSRHSCTIKPTGSPANSSAAAGKLTNDGTNAYSYDLAGNRTMAGYATGTGNQLTSQGAWAYTYDTNGNLTSKSQGPSATTWTYGYDVNNRLTTVQDKATAGGT